MGSLREKMRRLAVLASSAKRSNKVAMKVSKIEKVKLDTYLAKILKQNRTERQQS